MLTLQNDMPEANNSSVKYEEAQNEYLFDIRLSHKKTREFAVLFVNADGSFYTARIIKGASHTEFTAEKKRISQCVMLRIIDIENEEEIFSACFKPEIFAVEAEEGAKEICEPKEIKERNDARLQVNEEDFLNTETASNTDVREAKEKEEESAERIFLHNRGNVQRGAARNPISLAVKGTSINKNPEVLDDIFIRFTGYEGLLKNHVFYVYDKALSKKHSLNIDYNGKSTLLQNIFEGYENPFITKTEYPRELVGRVSVGGRPEYFVLGMLGRNLKEEQPFAGATGFTFFHKLPESEFGYWMSYISAFTGNICLSSAV